MRTPTGEQKAVLESPARVRVVCATPGSGKTWLLEVAQKLRGHVVGSEMGVRWAILGDGGGLYG